MQLFFLLLPLLFVKFRENVNNLPASIITTVLADNVRKSRLMAMTAYAKLLARERMVRAHTVAFPLGMLHPDNHGLTISRFRIFGKFNQSPTFKINIKSLSALILY